MKKEEDLISTLRDAQAYLRWIQGLGQVIQLEAHSATQAPGTEISKPRTIVQCQTESDMTEKATIADRVVKAASTAVASGAACEIPPEKDQRLERLDHIVQACRKCRLGYSRTQAVFGSGSRTADLMFIGEAPGANEDKTGLPFVGQAGKVLNAELEKNGITRDEVFICNIIKCRPPDNRDPLPDEIEACVPYLHEQIELIRPKMLCGLGRYACSVLMAEAIKIMKIRGSWSTYQGLPMFVCLHPSAVLHQPNNRQLFNDDIAKLAKAYRER
ncbi:MAG: uracil-DNA glycosylase [Candidatus Sumerlaeaceae bacterium]